MKVRSLHDGKRPLVVYVVIKNSPQDERKALRLAHILVERGWSFRYRFVRVARYRYVHKFWIFGIGTVDEFRTYFGKHLDSILP